MQTFREFLIFYTIVCNRILSIFPKQARITFYFDLDKHWFQGTVYTKKKILIRLMHLENTDLLLAAVLSIRKKNTCVRDFIKHCCQFGKNFRVLVYSMPLRQCCQCFYLLFSTV